MSQQLKHESNQNIGIPKSIRFLFGGTAGIVATCVVHPFSLLKNRMQMSGEGGKIREHKTSFHAVHNVIKNEGFKGLYIGLSAGLLRQATWATIRIGTYTTLFEQYSNKYGTPPGFSTKIALGMTAGAIGQLIVVPLDLCLVRMTSDGRLPPAERRGYTNVFNALIRITREEGILTLWRGCVPTMGRAIVGNAAQFASYSQSKQILLSTKYFNDNIICHFTSSMISGLVTTTMTIPIDITKTRIQNMKIINGKPEYRGVFDVLFRVIRNEGFFSLWKGFTPFYLIVGPHTVISFILIEKLNRFYMKYILGLNSSGGGL